MTKIDETRHEVYFEESDKSKTLSFDVFEGEQAHKEYKRLEKEYGKGISTGYSRLNNYFRFLPGQLYLLSAPTHHGKTMLAVNMCSYVSMLKKKVLFISLEQGIFISQFVKELSGKFPETFSILDTHEMLSVSELLEILKNLNRYDLICIDHIHFLRRKGKGATEDIDEIIHELQNVAKDLQTPFLVIAHLRKLNSDKPPSLDDLKDTVALSQVPSVVMLLQRAKDEDGLSDDGVLYIKKNRIQGKTGAEKFYIHEKFKITFDEDKPDEDDLIEYAEKEFNE